MPTPQLVRTSLGVERVENIENPANIYSIRAAAVRCGKMTWGQPPHSEYSASQEIMSSSHAEFNLPCDELRKTIRGAILFSW